MQIQLATVWDQFVLISGRLQVKLLLQRWLIDRLYLRLLCITNNQVSLPLFRESPVLPEIMALLDPWCVILHITNTWKQNQISLCYNGELIQVILCSPSPTQGPRGLPGERGRPGPSGVAVSVVFSSLKPDGLDAALCFIRVYYSYAAYS